LQEENKNMANPIPPIAAELGQTNTALVGASTLKRGSVVARGNAVTIDTNGMFIGTAVGTATARNVANTNALTRLNRVLMAGGATAGNMAELFGAAQFLGGAAKSATTPESGGFKISILVAISDPATVANARSFFGLTDSASALTNVEVTTLTNILGFAQVAADTNMRVVYNDASGTASSIDLGSSFPMTDGNLYELGLVWEPGGDRVRWSVYRPLGNVVGADINTYYREGELTTDIPALTVLLAFHLWRCNNADARATGFDLAHLVIDSVL
jgi:hypothetical protein